MLELEPHRDCNYDYVAVFEGAFINNSRYQNILYQ